MCHQWMNKVSLCFFLFYLIHSFSSWICFFAHECHSFCLLCFFLIWFSFLIFLLVFSVPFYTLVTCIFFTFLLSSFLFKYCFFSQLSFLFIAPFFHLNPFFGTFLTFHIFSAILIELLSYHVFFPITSHWKNIVLFFSSPLFLCILLCFHCFNFNNWEFLEKIICLISFFLPFSPYLPPKLYFKIKYYSFIFLYIYIYILKLFSLSFYYNAFVHRSVLANASILCFSILSLLIKFITTVQGCESSLSKYTMDQIINKTLRQPDDIKYDQINESLNYWT